MRGRADIEAANDTEASAMNEENKNEAASEPGDETPRPIAEAAYAQPEGAEAAEPEQLSELDALQAENASLKDRTLRLLADMENLRRRTEKEVADAKAYGAANFAREMLTFADNLQRILDNLPADSRTGLDSVLAALVEGIELTERDFQSRLARFGVKKIEAHGQRFDPSQHEALFEVADESVANGTIMQVIEPGYLIGERVLRPAKVGVSRGGPKNG